MSTTLTVPIQLRFDTASRWSYYNPILRVAEFGVVKGTSNFKIGNGTNHWNDLAYANGSSSGEGGVLNIATLEAMATPLLTESVLLVVQSAEVGVDTPQRITLSQLMDAVRYQEVSVEEMETPTSTALRSWSPLDVSTVAEIIATLVVGDALVSVNNSITSLDNRVTTLESGVAALTETVETLDGTVEGLATDLTNLDNTVSDLQSTVGGLNSTVGALSTTVGEHSTAIEGLGSAQADLANVVNQLDSDLTEVSDDLATLTENFNNLDLSLSALGATALHGVVSGLGLDSFSFDGTTFTVTPAHVYYYEGTKVEVAAGTTGTLLSPPVGWCYVYYAAADGTIVLSSSVFSYLTHVPLARFHWNGISARMIPDYHSVFANRQWLQNQHQLVGLSVKASDWALSAPSIASPLTISVAGGTAYCLDNWITYAAQTTGILWYQTVSGVTWASGSTPYAGGNVSYLNPSTYELTALDSDKFINLWVYLAVDEDTPIQFFAESHADGGYTTSVLAQHANPPDLTAMGMSPHIRLIYRLVYKGDGTLVTIEDLRSVGMLPRGAGLQMIPATAVKIHPIGTMTETTVQAVLESIVGGGLGHDALGGLTADDHSQYALLAGRSATPEVTSDETLNIGYLANLLGINESAIEFLDSGIRITQDVYAEGALRNQILGTSMGPSDMYNEHDKRGVNYRFLTNMALHNCRILGSSVEALGSMRVSDDGVQIYLNGAWQDVVLGFRFREDENEGYELEHKPAGFILWYEVATGDCSDMTDLNGRPLVQAYKVSMGPYQLPCFLAGGEI